MRNDLVLVHKKETLFSSFIKEKNKKNERNLIQNIIFTHWPGS